MLKKLIASKIVQELLTLFKKDSNQEVIYRELVQQEAHAYMLEQVKTQQAILRTARKESNVLFVIMYQEFLDIYEEYQLGNTPEDFQRMFQAYMIYSGLD